MLTTNNFLWMAGDPEEIKTLVQDLEGQDYDYDEPTVLSCFKLFGGPESTWEPTAALKCDDYSDWSPRLYGPFGVYREVAPDGGEAKYSFATIDFPVEPLAWWLADRYPRMRIRYVWYRVDGTEIGVQQYRNRELEVFEHYTWLDSRANHVEGVAIRKYHKAEDQGFEVFDDPGVQGVGATVYAPILAFQWFGGWASFRGTGMDLFSHEFIGIDEETGLFINMKEEGPEPESFLTYSEPFKEGRINQYFFPSIPWRRALKPIFIGEEFESWRSA